MKIANYLFSVLSFFLLTINLLTYSQGCLPEGMIFGNQQQIDDFQVDYPGCTLIEGDVTIWGSDIVNLEGLNVLTGFGGSLQIGLYYMNGTSLINFSGLENVTSIAGNLIIAENIELVSLIGIENIETIGGSLTIHFNPVLSNCDAESICNYLTVPNGYITIEINAPGYNSIAEVEEACESCLPDGMLFGSQEAIDNFQENYPMCTEIGGGIFITSSYGTPVTNLTGLESITSIGGELWIFENEELTSLSGLENLCYIGGGLHLEGNLALYDISALSNLTSNLYDLWITNCHVLNNLEGLEGISSITDWLKINQNMGLNNLSGLDNLESVGDISIKNNAFLTNIDGLNSISTVNGQLKISWGIINNLDGLESLEYIGGNFIISLVPIQSMHGLENLLSINGDLHIRDTQLQNLDEFESLEEIGGGLIIGENQNLSNIDGLISVNLIGANPEGVSFDINTNPLLSSLSGLDNMNSDSITNIEIYNNDLLSECDIASICDYLASPTGTINIYDNAPGCNSPEEVEEACEALYSCLPEGIIFTTQEQINNFHSNYPSCTEIEGDVTIDGTDITNLDSLSVLTSIGGFLQIWDCFNLESLTGLEGITNVGGELSIHQNELLENLEGLNGISTVGGDLWVFTNDNLVNLSGLDSLNSIGGIMHIDFNPSLTSLTALASLTDINGSIAIGYNSILESLEGLNNINPLSISNLNIAYNPNLSHCHIQSVCDYLVEPNGTVEIHDNALNCASQEEVEDACFTCLPYGINFTNQEQIDNFQEDYPNCTEIGGEVFIEDSGGSITNLNGLNVITSIGEGLSFYGTGLTSLDGLENLTTIGGSLYLDNMYMLTDMTALSNLTSDLMYIYVGDCGSLTNLSGLEGVTLVEQTLNIQNNQSLENFDGLIGLTYIGDIHVMGNDNLQNIEGLSNVVTLDQNLSIQDSPQLASLAGLELLTEILGNCSLSNLGISNFEGLNNIISIGGGISFGANINLTSVDGWDNLSAINDNLYIYSNPLLTDLTGFINIKSLGTSATGESLMILSNAALTSLAGLDSISPNSISNIQIYNNSLLEECDVYSICQNLVNPNGEIIIQDNADGCNSFDEVLFICWSGNDEIETLSEVIQIFPNPAKDEITIQCSDKIKILEVCIFSQTGKKIICHKGIEKTIDISEMKPGLYFIEITTINSQYREKLIIQ